MSRPITVLVRHDGPDFERINEAIKLANDLQSYFRFAAESPKWLPRESRRARPLADRAFRRQLQAHDGRSPIVVITSTPLWGDWFAFAYRDLSVISTHEWEQEFAPPPLRVYLVYQLAFIAAIVAGDLTEPQIEKMYHRPKGCPFDNTYGPEEFRVSLVGAHLCAACEGRLSEMGTDGEALNAISEILGYVRAATIRRVRVPPTNVFIGHGKADDWKLLQQFLQDDLRCAVVEFNSDPSAGIYTGQRILDMLDRSKFAFLVMTAEDEQADGTVHARPNVIHEIGLCQGRLGFSRSVILKAERAAEFSNMHGITYISFQEGRIAETFPEVVRTLVREGLLDAVVAERTLRTRK